MGVWKGFVWAVGRNTEWGRRQLGEETLLEQGVRHQVGERAVQAVLGYSRDGRGRLVHTSGKWQQGDLEYTVSSTDDPAAPGGYFMSISWPHPTKSGQREHTSIVFDANGFIADTASNRHNGWL